MRFLRSFLATTALAVVATGCDLAVTNPNNPARQQVLGNPADVEALASTQFQQLVLATHASIAAIQTGMMTASLMNASTLANNGMGPRSLIPRATIENTTGNPYQGENYREYRLLSFVARNSVDILLASEDPFFDLAGGQADVNRLRAWAYFMYALSTGYLAMAYDNAGIPLLEDPVGQVPPFVPPLYPYSETAALSLEMFDRAHDYASRSAVSNLPGSWLTGPQGLAVTPALFRQVIRSYQAVVRAGVARNPAERGLPIPGQQQAPAAGESPNYQVDWAKVVAEATAGIASDFNVDMNPSLGWDYQWLATTLHFRDANWHQMTPYIIGMADVSGGFDVWLQQHRDLREPFLIITPDLRFPQGATRAAQTRPSADDNSPLPEGQYIRNRNAGKDQAAVGWRNSFYDHYRHRAFGAGNRIGAFPLLTKAEVDMLAAEGYLRAGPQQNTAAAAQLINITRTRAGLPALTGDEATVPGGDQCVPRVPLPQGGTACGSVFEAMKWEKRMETAYTSWGAWFFDARGWGDLVVGTALQWPTPVNDLNARGLPTYNLGGLGNAWSAQSNTYGYGTTH
jgi:hypothetical protein